MEKQRETKVIAVLALLVAIVGISVGFAAMSTTLNIQGTAEMRPASWDIKFANLSSPILAEGATILAAPSITTNSTVLGDFDVQLTKPGSKATYTFDIVNAGDINAYISSFIKSATPICTGTGTDAAADETLVCGNLVYTLKYTTGGAAVGLNDTLDAGDTKNVTLTIEYPATMEFVPKEVVEISGLAITMIYAQV